MNIFIQTPAGKIIAVDVQLNNYVEDVKTKICSRERYLPEQQCLIFQSQQLEDEYPLSHYCIRKDDIINLIIRLRGGGYPAKNPSEVLYQKKKFKIHLNGPLVDGNLCSRYIRATNATPVYIQQCGNCYVFASSSAYLNTANQIYGHQKLPSFQQCISIADYTHGSGGSSSFSLIYLEQKFNLGIRWETKEDQPPSIRDVMLFPHVLTFQTNQRGFQAIENGSLSQLPSEEGGDYILNGKKHAVMIEGYDFGTEMFICKNSWEQAAPRFELKFEALNMYSVTKVFWTNESIQGKTLMTLQPKIAPFQGRLNGEVINCAWMDKDTACYSQEYVAEYHEEKEDELNYLGYQIDEWIASQIRFCQMKKNEFEANYQDDTKNDHKSDLTFTKLHFASKINDLTMTKRLIIEGADVNAKDILY